MSRYFGRRWTSATELIQPLLTHSLLDVLYGDDPAIAELIHDTAYTQPAIFAIEYSLAALWRSRGVRPVAVVGHSIGEYAAACVAGILSLRDAATMIAARGRLMGDLAAGGTMAAVFADESTVRSHLGRHDDVAIAAINGPANVVISGAAHSIEAVLSSLGAAGVTSRPLNVSNAFHSPLMDPMLEAFTAVAATVELGQPTIPFVSTVSGSVDGRSRHQPPVLGRPRVGDGPLRGSDQRRCRARCRLLRRGRPETHVVGNDRGVRLRHPDPSIAASGQRRSGRVHDDARDALVDWLGAVLGSR